MHQDVRQAKGIGFGEVSSSSIGEGQFFPPTVVHGMAPVICMRNALFWLVSVCAEIEFLARLGDTYTHKSMVYRAPDLAWCAMNRRC